MLAQVLQTAGCEWSVAVEATGWELMLQFAKYGVGIAVVNDFCSTPTGLVAVPLEGVPKVAYYVIGREGFTSQGTDAMRQLIIETLRS